ncbi:response regulator transcription factor [Parapedobacter sp. ISTM3]|uniref:Two component transcriptional regulator, LuxR family n=2 Tax=Parapedobacter TaxID=416949 RepID=A0A1T5BU01_9SPHI|nr:MULTISPECIES: response regulator transcription factor [Parapedobacter]MBK1439994.1 response regulator transcription factor [Parapedobacter sp. ISTM3]SFB91533.1 DNA-binding response regulator, NarL/FixJ family, contains REC and HTH domains [Parapedobacter composti]SKB50715.1 two component transcriptional regulator, LuxR family [Parapedobacter luteus]
MVSIFITDDHPLVLEGLKNVLSEADGFQVSGCFANAAATLEAIGSEPPAVLLLDINLPDINGIDLVRKVKALSPATRIIALSVHNEYAVINSMFQEGADGYIQKNAVGEEIVDGIRTVINGRRFLCSQSAEIMKRKTTEGLKSVPKVTRREKEILHQAAKGLTTQEIAAVLFISPHTVESHRKNLMEKFEVKNLASAIKLAMEYGLIQA